MSSPVRSVVVRLSMDPSSYVAGAARAEKSTLSLDAAAAKVGGTSATSMEKAAAGAGKAEGALGKLNKTAGTLGFTLGGLAGAGVLVGGALSVKWAADYQQALTKLVTTAGEAPKNLAAVSKGFLDMAGQVGISADEIAKGAYLAESAGFHGADVLTVMKATTQGAKQEGADLGHVVDAVTTALHDYNLPASDAVKVTSQLITAVSHGKTTFDELTGAMHSVTPLAAALHVPLADVAGVLSSMTASGESADQAAQNMADALRHMQNPTSTMTAELAQLGITSTDLGPMLGQKGLAGTIQTISTAILKQMGPAGTVMLDALNKSKVATDDLAIMLKQMPPALARQSQALLDGKTSIKAYQQSAKEFGGAQGAMALQFLSLVKSSQGFNNMLKSGQPDVQTYTAALQKAMGTSAGLTVALQVTGEHAGATNAAIADIAKASGDAQGNIKGWGEVQGNFNQRLAEFEAGAKSLAIEAGQHLLPLLTSGLGWLDDHGPGILRALTTGMHDAGVVITPLAHDAEDLVHAFGELPAPIKDTVLALAGLKLAMNLNFLGVSSAVTGVKASFAGMREEMALQQALWAAEQRSAMEAGRTYGAMESALGGMGGTTEAAAAGATKLEGALGTLQARGIAGVKAGASGLMSMLGGPWGLAVLGAAYAASRWESDLEDVTKAQTDAKNAGEALGDTYIKLGTIFGEQAMNARQAAIQQSGLADAFKKANVDAGSLTTALQGNKKAQSDVVEQMKRQDAAQSSLKGTMNPLTGLIDMFTGKSNEASNATKTMFDQLNQAKDRYYQFSQNISSASSALASYQQDADRVFGKNSIDHPGLDSLQTGMDELAKSSGNTQKSLQGIQDIMAGLTGNGVSAAQATADLTQATTDLSHGFDNMAKGALDAKGNIDLNTQAGAELFHNLQQLGSGFNTAVNEAYSAAGGINNAAAASDAAGKAASQLYQKFMLTAEGAGMSHDAAAALAKQLGLVPGDVVTHFTQPGMSESQTAADILFGKITQIPGSKSVRVDTLDQAAITELENVGYKVQHMPDGSFTVTAKTDQAKAELSGLINQYQNYPINLIAHGIAGHGGAGSANATGGVVHAYASGGLEPMAGGIAKVVAPNTWRIIGDRVKDDEFYIPDNSDPRSLAIGREYLRRHPEVATPVAVRSRELVSGGGGGAPAPIDYGRLAAAVAAAIPDRPTVQVDHWESTADQSPMETAEALAFLSRTRPNG